jgi:hypothetical protein
MYGFGGGTWSKGTTWKAQDMDWRLIVERILKKLVGGCGLDGSDSG